MLELRQGHSPSAQVTERVSQSRTDLDLLHHHIMPQLGTLLDVDLRDWNARPIKNGAVIENVLIPLTAILCRRRKAQCPSIADVEDASGSPFPQNSLNGEPSTITEANNVALLDVEELIPVPEVSVQIGLRIEVVDLRLRRCRRDPHTG